MVSKKAAKKAGKVITRLLLKKIYRFFYLTGLTMVVPFLYVLTLSKVTQPFTKTTITLLLFAVLFIVGGIGGIYRLEKRMKTETLKSIGFITLIPALVTIFFALISPQLVFGVARSILPAIDPVLPVINLYLNRIMIRLKILTLVYLLLGGFLILIGTKMEK